MRDRFLFALAILTSTAALAAPTPVFIGMHVIELRSVDARAQSFYADFYLWERFNAAGLTPERIELIERIEPVNGKFDTKDFNDEKIVGDEHYICHRVTGTFFFVPELKKYPFDTQVLPISMEASTLENDEVVLVDDRESYAKSKTPELRWGLSPTLSIPDYVLKRVDREVSIGEYPTNFGDPTKDYAGTHYSRFTLSTHFEREYWSYAFKILVPLLIILLMAWLVFFLPPAQLDTAASVAMTALLSCMAYNVAVSQQMPEIGYLVLSDQFFIATYVLLLIALGLTFLVFTLDANDRGPLAVRINRATRVLFPVAVAAIFFGFLAKV